MVLREHQAIDERSRHNYADRCKAGETYANEMYKNTFIYTIDMSFRADGLISNNHELYPGGN